MSGVLIFFCHRFCDLLVSCDTAATSDPSTGNAGTPYQSLSGALEAVLKLKDTVSESIDVSLCLYILDRRDLLRLDIV